MKFSEWKNMSWWLSDISNVNSERLDSLKLHCNDTEEKLFSALLRMIGVINRIYRTLRDNDLKVEDSLYEEIYDIDAAFTIFGW